MRFITALAFTLERPAIRLGRQSKSPGIQCNPFKNQISTKVTSSWFGSGYKFIFQGFYIVFLWVWTFLQMNTGIYFDFVETANMRDGWYLWCSLLYQSKCRILEMFGDQLLSNSIMLCVYIYVLINFWLCYVIKFTWMIQQRWKTFDATVRRGFCPFLTLEKKTNFRNPEVELILWHQLWADAP